MTDEVIQMDAVKCQDCGKVCKNERALKIHRSHIHAGKPSKATAKPAAIIKDTPKAKKAAKKATPKAAKKAAFACEICGKQFRMSAHLARHMSTIHAKAATPKSVAKKTRKATKKAAKTAKPVVVAAYAAPSAAAASPDVDVRAMTVDQLLTLKSAVDARLADIVKQVRQKLRIAAK